MSTDESAVDLASYQQGDFTPGRSLPVRVAWYLVSLLLFESGWFALGRPKVWLLRIFGAQIGAGLVIKPRVRIKFPWRLSVGNHCWIGESAWIDNLALVGLGDHVCLSQGVYLCTGSHDYRSQSFDLLTLPIHVESGAWVAARAIILGGVRVGSNAIVTAGSVATKDVPAGWIFGGNPACGIKIRDSCPASPENATKFGDGK